MDETACIMSGPLLATADDCCCCLLAIIEGGDEADEAMELEEEDNFDNDDLDDALGTALELGVANVKRLLVHEASFECS